MKSVNDCKDVSTLEVNHDVHPPNGLLLLSLLLFGGGICTGSGIGSCGAGGISLTSCLICSVGF